MTANKIDAATQDNIVQSISSFALYGFPESHAASFALIAYASAYLKQHYLAAFTCAMLNNQPMGFYMPAVLVKDAQRHGLRIKPIDVQQSDWLCTVEDEEDGTLSLRLGLMYAKGFHRNTAEVLVDGTKFARTIYRSGGSCPESSIAQPQGHGSTRTHWSNQQCGSRGPSSGRTLAGGAGRSSGWSTAATGYECSSRSRLFSVGKDVDGRKDCRRLFRNWTHHRASPYFLHEITLKAAKHTLRQRTGQDAKRSYCASGWMHNCATETGHCQRIRLSVDGR